MKAIFKKIISFISGLLVISIITFILTKFTSQDPAENYLRIRHLPITPAALENARTYLGLVTMNGIWHCLKFEGQAIVLNHWLALQMNSFVYEIG